jgi:hypothetical protein
MSHLLRSSRHRLLSRHTNRCRFGAENLSLWQQLSRTSQFSDSRRGAPISARSLFRNLPANQQTAKLDAIVNGFDAVGIT